MALRSRLHLLRPPSVASSLLPNCPYPLSFASSLVSWNHRRPRFPSLRYLCSISDPKLQETATRASSPSIVGDLLDYLNESWTQFHATAEAKRQLIAAGFQLLNEADDWDLQPGSHYFFTRNMSFLVALQWATNIMLGVGSMSSLHTPIARA